MATSRYQSNDLRRQIGSPRAKGRGQSMPKPASTTPRSVNPPLTVGSKENKDTLCRNILIYGHCRYEDQGCTFSHDQNKTSSSTPELPKKALNVESPSFTPSNLQSGGRKTTFSSQAASAPAFTPRGLGGSVPVTPQEAIDASVFNPATVREFTPGFDINTPIGNSSSVQDGVVFHDPFIMPPVGPGLAPTPYNPYADDHGPMGPHGASYFPPQAAFAQPLQPLQHHLYAPVGPYREDLMPYHRMTHDFFIPEKLREEYQKRSEAALQVMPVSQLPQLEHYHSLVALDTSHRKNASIFGYPSWVYKATSTKNGNLYCLRRLEGYRLTSEHAIRTVKEWRRIDNGNVVTIHDAFTTRAFGDSSLVFVQDYHPLSKTLAEAHLTPSTTHGNRYQPKAPISETVLWGYITQIANAIRAIHAANLSARCLDPSKIILTDKHRVRLNACSILDVVQYDTRRPLADYQQEDFVGFGKVLLCLTTNTLPAHITNVQTTMEQMSKSYSAELRDTVAWLLTPQQPPAQKGMDEFVRGISGRIIATLDQTLHASDKLNSELYRELENGRVARLMMKLGTINERSESEGERAWSENGERYMLKLFRDYVFHQVDSQGKPVIDMGHMLRCLNKLDAGTDERVLLTSRDEQSSFLVSYKELKKQLGAAFGELVKGAKQPRAF